MKSPLVHELVVNKTLNAPRERVFRAWSDPDLLKVWLGGQESQTRHVSVDFRVGGMYQVDMVTPAGDFNRLSGMYQEIEAPQKLVFTWSWGEDYSADAATLVTVILNENAGKTHMTLKHERFDNVPARDIHGQGWELCVNRLVKLLS